MQWQEGQKPKSRLASVSQLMTHGHFLIQMGSGLGTLQQGEIISTMKEIREDIFLTAYASFIVELTDKATEDKNIIRIYLKCYIKRCIICVRVLIRSIIINLSNENASGIRDAPVL